MNYWKLSQLAERWQVSTQTVRRWVREGRLTAIHIGRSVRVTGLELARFEANWRGQGAEQPPTLREGI